MEQLLNAQEEFKCPICLLYISPPIRQCEIGHIMCEKCYKNVSTCPVCRGPTSEHRALMSEKLYEKLQISCIYKLKGCNFKIFGGSASEHEEKCLFAPKCCPLRNLLKCGWSGDYPNVLKHCQELHPGFVRKGSKHTIVMENLNENFNGKEFCTVIQAHGEIFQLRCCVYDDHMRWRFSLIGLEDDLVRYFCRISIGSFEIELKPMLSDNNDILSANECSIVNMAIARNICNDTNLQVFVQIFDMGLELYLNELS